MNPGGMTQQQSRTEAERCLGCFEAPCSAACPAGIRIPEFIGMLRSGNVKGAAQVVRSANTLAATCGAVCPEEVYCQAVCNRGKLDRPIRIRELHSWATARGESGGVRFRPFPGGGEKAAVVGAGPAGLSCAFELAKLGHAVDLFEAQSPGGVPRTSIPPFRLPKGVGEADVKLVTKNVTLRKNRFDADTLAGLREKYRAVFLGVGLGKDRRLGIKGEHLIGVVPVLEFLQEAKARPQEVAVGKRTVVIGGGNVSLDAAATAKQLGAAEVVLIYRRGEAEMRVWTSELEEARSRGVEIRYLTSPIQIVGSGQVEGVLCVRTRLSEEVDATGRRLPVEVEGSTHLVGADMVVIAVGQVIQPGSFPDLKRNRNGYILVDGRFHTSQPGLFAGGDAVTGEGTVVLAVAHGKAAAHAMHSFLAGKRA